MDKKNGVLVAVSHEDFDGNIDELIFNQINIVLKVNKMPFQNKIVKEGLFFIDTNDLFEVAELLSKIPGIEFTAVVESLSSKYEELIQSITTAGIKTIFPGESFDVRVHLKGELPYSARDIVFASCGSIIGELGETGIKQDDKLPDKIIYTLIHEDLAFIFHHKYEGIGGRPVGSSGKALCLFSEDYCNAVATWLMMRKGIFPHILFFDTRPYITNSEIRQAITMATILREFLPIEQYSIISIKMRPIIEYLEQNYSSQILPSILDKIMLKIACIYADKIDVNMIVSGENIVHKDAQSYKLLLDILIEYDKYGLFPLIGLNNREISEYSKTIGFFDYIPVDRKKVKKILNESDQKLILSKSDTINELINSALNSIELVNIKDGYNDLHEILNDFFRN